MKFAIRRKVGKELVFLVGIAFSVLVGGCKEAPEAEVALKAESDLISKINAVQEQLMAQGDMSLEEEQALLGLCNIVSHDDGLAHFSPEDRMILKNVDKAPVYQGCENLSQAATRSCFKDQVSSFIIREFDLSISKNLKLSEPKQVAAFFIINENGNLTGMKVRDAEVSIQAEILRVLRKMPIMKPATHDGESVAVLCSMTLTYGNEIGVEMTYIPERPDQ